MTKKSLGWIEEKMHCRIEKYVDSDSVRYKINCGDDVFVIGFSDFNEALKFTYKMAWVVKSKKIK